MNGKFIQSLFRVDERERERHRETKRDRERQRDRGSTRRGRYMLRIYCEVMGN